MSSCEIRVHTGVPSAQVTLLDHAGAVVAGSTGGSLQQAGLGAGIYRVQVETGATLTEELVSVREDATVDHYVHLLLPTVTPVNGVSLNNEVHSDPARALSVQPTLMLGTGARLVIFTRVTQRMDALPPVHLGGLTLLDADGNPVLTPPHPTLAGAGFAGISVDLDPGSYLLRAPLEETSASTSEATADQSVPLLPDWTTYLFLPALPLDESDGAEWKPAPAGMVTHMKRLGDQFEPYDYGSDAFFAAETALDGLRAGQLLLPDGGWDAVFGNLELNPMLGVYVGHAAIGVRGGPDAELTRLVDGLLNLAPGHPDVIALRCALKDRAGDRSPTDVEALVAPPMLRSSYQLLIARDATEPTLLVDGSLAEHVVSRQRADGVWLRWDTPTGGDELVELDATMMTATAAAVSAVVYLPDEEKAAVAEEPAIELSERMLRLDRFRAPATYRMNSDRSTGWRTTREAVGSGPQDEQLSSPDDLGDLGHAAPPPPSPVEAPVDLPVGAVPREVADLAEAIRQMAAHSEGTEPVSVAALSRQLGLPSSKVSAGLAELARMNPDH